MKVGLLFAGIAFGHKSDRDFNHCFPNISKNLIEPLKAEHDVEVYCLAYEDPRVGETVALLNPVKFSTLSFEGSRQNTTRKLAVDILDGEDLDFYIMSRFDVHYTKHLKDFNLDYNKFNFTSPEGNGYWDREKWVGDTFYAWPKRLHEEVKIAYNEIMKYDPNHMHNFYNIVSSIIGTENIHFMSTEPQLSGHLLTSICTKDYADRLRNKIPIDPEILLRFP